ncbi:MAG TPA: glycoside hydrolase family 32 protein [Prolixibacteraceae bacterium]|nr:glycoside hydrolase family 32 protein [Prolixibacteraceae bacterium]
MKKLLISFWVVCLTLPAFTDTIKIKSTRYDEKYRPQFHFSPATQWTNDPNGLVYFEGEYHLFYQYYPDSIVWGPMHWGHAISKDLVHWEHLPIALYPDSLGWIFSGSAVVDKNNTSGFGSMENPPMVAIYSYHNEVLRKGGRKDFQTQGIAYSLDKGRTWIKYNGNPVLKNPGFVNFRDPKVSWHKPSQRWVMVLAVGDHVSLYSSHDLKSWEFESDFGKNAGAHNGTWECPDLFPLTDMEGNERWILLASIIPGGPNGGTATQYFVGDFDGSIYTSQDSLIRWLDFGRDNYAGVTYNNIPEEDGRRIFIGWMSNWDYANQVPTTVWRNAMTLPRTLGLVKRGNSNYLKSSPIKELKTIENDGQSIMLNDQVKLIDSLCHIHLQFEDVEKGFMLKISNKVDEKVLIQFIDGEFKFDRTNSGLSAFNKGFAGIHSAPFQGDPRNIVVDIYVDLSSVEVFINNGEVVFTELVFPSKPYQYFEVTQGKNQISTAKIYQMKTIW